MPFHTWLPRNILKSPDAGNDAADGSHVQDGRLRPSAAGIANLRHELAQVRTPLLVLATLTVVAGAWAAAVQKDLKRVFAYSSVYHLGYCLLGIFVMLYPRDQAQGTSLSQTAALDGVGAADVQSWPDRRCNLLVPALLEERSGGPLGINDFGGLRKPAQSSAGLMGHRALLVARPARIERLRQRIPHLPRSLPAQLGAPQPYPCWDC